MTEHSAHDHPAIDLTADDAERASSASEDSADQTRARHTHLPRGRRFKTMAEVFEALRP